MALVVLATWKKYAKKSDDDVTGEALYQTFLDSAEQIVKDYLGYDPASQTYTAQELDGNGSSSIVLKAKPITALSAITINGVSRGTTDFDIEGERITDSTGALMWIDCPVVVTYTAGLSAGDMRLSLIQLTIMDIASLLSMNNGDNIGVSSVTLDGGNTRSFVNYNNFSKQLARLANLKLARLP
jgi:hypothetical protein